MSRRIVGSALAVFVCGVLSFLTSCSSSSSKTSTTTPTPSAITPVSGTSPQSAQVGAAFGTALAATVTDSSGSPVSGASVTFTAPSSGASGTFKTSGSATETDTTNSSGVATSSTFTANMTAGAYTVTAAVSGVSTTANFNLTNTAAVVTNPVYVFYASGTEVPNASTNGSSTPLYYALAGAVAINSSGNVVSGEEDYNDGVEITELDVPITGGALTVDATTGQGTLTLQTANTLLGVSGTETLGVQFANTDHALIVQFDESATSSGSLDLQTSGTSSGSNSFLLSGVDSGYDPVGYGGVYSVSSGAITGVADVNDDGTIATGNEFTATAGSPDSLGRGAINNLTINGVTLALYYYNVGPETTRIIDMDVAGTVGAGAAAVGSTYGQGSTTFTNSSLGNSVVGLEGDPFGLSYAVAGSIITTPTSGTFTGTADDRQDSGTAQAISGTYSVSNSVASTTYNGYSSLSITNSPLANVASLGVYMTDPALNLLDPNNTSGGGGALVLDLDSVLSGGTGIVIPQTDTTSANFNGTYALGAQEYFAHGGVVFEFDYLGQGSVSSLGLSGSGLVSDPFAFFGPSPALYTDVSMTGTATPDPAEATNGRYTMPLVVDAFTASPYDNLSLTIYQANGGQLLFIENSAVGFGSFQQQGSLTGLPANRRPVKKVRQK